MKILITGGSGFIGKPLVLDLLSHNHEIYLLARSKSINAVNKTFIGHPIFFFEGNIEDPEVVLGTENKEKLQEIDCLIHLAALYDLTAKPDVSYRANVLGTQNILNLAKRMRKLRFFHYFSTYAVNPNKEGIVFENDLCDNKERLSDFYSKTKNQAEHIVRAKQLPGINVIIHRPGIIIGDSNTGEMEKKDGPYYFFDFIERLKSTNLAQKLPFLPLPLHESSRLNVLPVDILVGWSSEIIRNPKNHKLRCYHLVPKEEISTLSFLKESMELMKLPLKIIPLSFLWPFSIIFPFLKIPKETIFYLQQQAIFNRSNLEIDYPHLIEKPFKEYLFNIIQGNRKNKS